MVGTELRRLRLERGLSPTDLARLSKVSRARIYKIEDGEGGQPTMGTLYKLAQGLAAWRDGTPDSDESRAVFQELQSAAGYPIDGPSTAPSDVELVPVPEPLARSFQQIVEGWPRWGQTERDHAAQLLDMVSHFGRDADTVVPDDSRTPEMKHSNNLALYLDCLDLDPSRIARAPIRELALAGI